MDTTGRDLIMQRWNVIQHELSPEVRNDVGTLTEKLEKVIYVLEWVRIEEFTQTSWCGVGRPPHERAWLANAFIAKTGLGLTSTVGLIERLTIDRTLRRICGFAVCKKLPCRKGQYFCHFAAKVNNSATSHPQCVALSYNSLIFRLICQVTWSTPKVRTQCKFVEPPQDSARHERVLK